MAKSKLKKGKAQPLWKCCREIRIQMPSEKEVIYSGLNTLTEEHEDWLLIKLNKDRNFHIMQRVFS